MSDIRSSAEGTRVRPTLGRLVSMAIREVWPREDRDFTPWLAEPENLSLLADTLRLRELQVEGTEVPVGDFSIDILARDGEGRAVVIENQFGPTDHRHLGQLLTYVAGQEGQATVVWIAEIIREEHRAAIDWLNATTVEDYDFFAVKIEALRIGTSPPAPLFNVLAKPNDWSRGVARTARAAAAAPLDDKQKAYVAYWARFASFLADRNAPFTVKGPQPKGEWCGFGHIARRRFTLGVYSSLTSNRRTVLLYAGHRAAHAEFDLLSTAKDEINAEFGAPLEWKRFPKSAQIEINRPELASEAEDVQFAWYLDQMERFVRVFRPRIEALPSDVGNEDEAASVGDPAAC